MIRRLQRRTAEAPLSRDEQRHYGIYRLVELHHVASTYQTATESMGALWNIQVAHG